MRPVAKTLRFAETLCEEKGLSFTPLRREIFALVLGHAAPVGAYELLDELKQKRPNAAPVTIYRGLDFLVDAGLVHRLAALNAYTACDTQLPGHGGLLLICGNCSNVIEFEDAQVEASITQSAAGFDFQTSREPVEVRGLCGSCTGNG
jgi:Fur family zinc uptake transcriptional regulator